MLQVLLGIKSIDGISGHVDSAAEAAKLTINGVDGSTAKVVDGTITILDATIVLEGAKVSADDKSCNADVKLTGITITMTKHGAITPQGVIKDSEGVSTLVSVLISFNSSIQ